jgi:hypothetical protein
LKDGIQGKRRKKNHHELYPLHHSALLALGEYRHGGTPRKATKAYAAALASRPVALFCKILILNVCFEHAKIIAAGN